MLITFCPQIKVTPASHVKPKYYIVNVAFKVHASHRAATSIWKLLNFTAFQLQNPTNVTAGNTFRPHLIKSYSTNNIDSSSHNVDFELKLTSGCQC